MNHEKIIKNMTPQQQRKLLNGLKVLPKNSKHTLETLVEILDLKHPDTINERCKDWDYYPRQSGRTTRMLLDACLAVQNQPVLVLGHTPYYTNSLQQDLWEMCTKAGIDTQNIIKKYIPMSFKLSEALKGYHNVKTFEDHYRLELMSKENKPKTFEEIIIETSEANPGAMMAIRALQYLSTWEEAVRGLHKHGIIGGKLYSLWSSSYGCSDIQWCEAVKTVMMIPGLTSTETYQILLDKAPLKNQEKA